MSYTLPIDLPPAPLLPFPLRELPLPRGLLLLLRRLLALCARKNLQLSQRALHTAPKTIRGRLMSYLSECAVRSGSSSFDIPYDRRQLGVERSALCAELSRMCRDGLILYGKRRFTLVTDLDD